MRILNPAELNFFFPSLGIRCMPMLVRSLGAAYRHTGRALGADHSIYDSYGAPCNDYLVIDLLDQDG